MKKLILVMCSSWMHPMQPQHAQQEVDGGHDRDRYEDRYDRDRYDRRAF